MADSVFPSSQPDVDLQRMKMEREGISQSVQKWQSILEYYEQEDPEHAKEPEDLVSKIEREFLRISREIEICEEFS